MGGACSSSSTRVSSSICYAGVVQLLTLQFGRVLYPNSPSVLLRVGEFETVILKPSIFTFFGVVFVSVQAPKGSTRQQRFRKRFRPGLNDVRQSTAESIITSSCGGPAQQTTFRVTPRVHPKYLIRPLVTHRNTGTQTARALARIWPPLRKRKERKPRLTRLSVFQGSRSTRVELFPCSGAS